MRLKTAHDRGAHLTTPDRAPWFTCLLEGPEFIYRYANDAYREAFGDKDYIGNSAHAMLPEIDDQVFFPLLREVFESGRPYHGDSPIYLGDWDEHGPVERRVQYSCTAVRDRRGDVTHISAEGRLWRPLRDNLMDARNRAITLGPKVLTDREHLGLFLSDGGEDRSAELLHRFGSLRGVFSASMADLQKMWLANTAVGRGLRAESILYLRVASEVQRRVLLQRVGQRPLLSSSRLVHGYLRASLAAEPREQFRVLFLDAGLKLIADEAMGEGTLTGVAVYTREVVRRALELSAHSLLLVHNHPSGAKAVSAQDKEITEDIIAAAKVLNIEVHDHLIVAGHDIVSLKTAGSIRGWATRR